MPNKQTTIKRLIIIWLSLLTTATIFAQYPAILDHRIVAKWYAFSLLLFSFGAIIFLLETCQSGTKHFFRLPVLIFPVSLFVIYTLIRTYVADSAIICLGVTIYSFIILYYLWLNYDALLITYFPIIALCVISLQGIYGIGQFIYAAAGENFSFSHITGSFDNTAGLASSISCGLPLGFYLHSKNKNLKYLLFTTIGIIVCGTIVSGARAGIITICVATIVYYWPHIKNLLKRISIGYKLLILFTVFCLSIFLYLSKKDSADGRMLIWKSSWELFQANPIWGYGYKGFSGNYMIYQANVLQQSPNSRYALLADDIKHPFNEFLHLLIEYGLVGFVLFAIVMGFIFYSFLKYPTAEKRMAMAILASVGAYACFSYPLNYPFIWVLLIFSLVIFSDKILTFSIHRRIRQLIMFMQSILCFCLIGYTISMIRCEILWYKASNYAQIKSDRSIVKYKQIEPFLSESPYFHYNYAAALNQAGTYEESINELLICKKTLNNVNTQLLLAENYIAIKDYDAAIESLTLASQMCPNRFMPLYKLVLTYRLQGDTINAKKLGRKILEKEVKIPSQTVEMIREKMKEYGTE